MSDFQEYIGDDWLLGGRNYLEPIYRDNPEAAAKFASNHKCAACLSQLIAVDSGDEYEIICPKCGSVAQSTVVTNHQAQAAEDDAIFGQMAINAAQSQRTEAEIMQDLGY